MKFSRILILLTIFTLISCKTYYDEPQEIEYSCILEKTQFFADIKNILVDEGFQVKEPDETRGYMIAEKTITNSKSEEVVLNLSIRYEDGKKQYFVTPSALKLPRDKNQIEYYKKKCIRKEYKPYFKDVLIRMESFCKGGYFPNR